METWVIPEIAGCGSLITRSLGRLVSWKDEF